MIAVMLAVAAAALPNGPAIAEIGRLEHRWGQAFVSRDFAFIETIIAPEFKLIVASPTGELAITPRLNGCAMLASTSISALTSAPSM